ILALNSGFNAYASNYQKKSLSKYPITVNKTQSSIADISGIVSNMSGNDFSTLDTVAIMDILSNDKSNMTAYTEEQIVYIEKLITGVADSLDDLMKENDTTDFKKYVDENFDTSIATVKYDYDLTLNVYNQKVNDSGLTYYSQISPLGTRTANSLESLNSMLSLMGLRLSTNDINNVRAALDNINFWDALVSDENVLNSQYDLLSGRWPVDDQENDVYEAVLVVDKYNRISDASLYALGYIEFMDLLQSLLLNSKDILSKLVGAEIDLNIGKELDLEYDFNEFIGKEFKLMLESDYYSLNEDGLYENKKDDKTFVNSQLGKATTVKISGIVRLKNTVSSGCINGDIGFSDNLVTHIIDSTLESDVVKAQTAEYEKYMELIATEQYQQYLNLLTALSKGDKTVDTLTPEEQMLFATQGTINIKSVVSGRENMSDASSYDTLMLDLGVKDKDEPNSILFFPTSIEAVDSIENFIGEYNTVMQSKYDNGEIPVNKTIEYKNELDTIMNSLSNMISTITYILVAVTCLAVVVSLFMVGIIMYISVQDRTKEIGILRSMGARKLDIMNIFNAETMLLGLLSGLLGVTIGYAISPLANMLLTSYLDISNLIQPIWWHSLILIGASVILTALSGLAPAIMAAKKDPVVSLKTE
ncbi:MAG: FtsX-like permease family protein, partial [Clostridia bacterium]|nr:FtsX-like permease family protein [Clostridia bacterium]